MIAAEELANVKAVLFGNQKQANVINDAVVSIVAQYLDSVGQDMQTEELVITGIQDNLRLIAERGVRKEEEVFVQLVAGHKSYCILKEGSPCVVSVNQPNTESPKHNFRILVLGEEDVEEGVESKDMDFEAGKHFEKPAAAPDEVFDPDDSIAEQTRKLKDAIIPMCPPSVKEELADEYAQALYCAQAYFSYNSR